jgi:hypothetical protein
VVLSSFAMFSMATDIAVLSECRLSGELRKWLKHVQSYAIILSGLGACIAAVVTWALNAVA